MSTEAELRQINTNLQELIDVVSNQSATMPNLSDRLRKTTLPRDENQRAKKAGDIISDKISKGFKKSIEKLPKDLQNAIDKSGNELAKNVAGSVKKIEDVLRVNDQISAMRQISAGLDDISKSKIENQEELSKRLNDLESIANSVGISLEKLGVKTDDLSDGMESTESAIEEIDKAADSLENSLKSATDGIDKFENSVQKAKSSLMFFINTLKETVKLAEEEVRFAVQRATADQGVIDGAYRLGISQIEYGKILASSRQTQMAMASSGIDFKDMLEVNTNRLKLLSYSNTEAAQVANLLAQNAASMGVEQSKLGNVVSEQITMYEKYGRAYAQSAIEAAKFTAVMFEDNDFRMEMVRLRGKERKQFILGLSARQAEYKTMGYTDERAKGLVKTFAALAGMSPKERMKKAAKKRAFLGALGMGAEGSELMDLEIRYQYMSAEEKEKAAPRMAKIQAQASKAMLEKTGAGANIGSAMAFGEFANVAGVNDMVTTFELESGKGRKHSEELVDNTNEVPKAVKEAKAFYDNVNSFMTSGIGGILKGVWTGLAGPFLSGLFAALTTAVIFSGGGGGPGKFIGKAMSKMGSVISGVVGAVSGAASGAMKTVGKVGSSVFGGNVSKSLFKSGIKKIPIIGALAGIGFGIQRLMSGDILGAAGEVASGVASIVPGVGTAASIGIDAALGVKDASEENKNIAGKPVNASNLSDKTKFTTHQETENELILMLKEIQTYLKAVNEQNTEQAKAVSKTGQAVIDGIHFNGMDIRRTQSKI